jgi:BirA family biotin operon repressor/biotin-[acetyl-CoA-carboxylase] ligase
MNLIKHIKLDIVDSTQLIAKRQICSLNTDQWYLWTAKGQTAGLGRENRCWLSPKDVNVYATYGFFINCKNSFAEFCISQVAAYAVLETLMNFGIEDITIKWPNDVLVEGKKLSGTLVDVLQYSEKKNAILIGIGVNVNATLKDLDGIDQACTSMTLSTKQNYSIEEVVKTLSAKLHTNISKWLNEGFAAFHDKINEKLYKFEGESIILLNGNEHYCGPIECIGLKGELRLSTCAEIPHYNGKILRQKAP